MMAEIPRPQDQSEEPKPELSIEQRAYQLATARATSFEGALSELEASERYGKWVEDVKVREGLL